MKDFVLIMIYFEINKLYPYVYQGFEVRLKSLKTLSYLIYSSRLWLAWGRVLGLFSYKEIGCFSKRGKRKVREKRREADSAIHKAPALNRPLRLRSPSDRAEMWTEGS